MADFNVISQLLSGRDEENQKHLLRQCMAGRPKNRNRKKYTGISLEAQRTNPHPKY